MPAKIVIEDVDTVSGCTKELAHIYRLARMNKMDLTRAKGLTWILKQLSGMIADHDFEKRLRALEDVNA